jgi:transposase
MLSCLAWEGRWRFCRTTCKGAEQPAEPKDLAPSISVASHTRRPRGPRALPASLPRAEVVHDIPEERGVCACGAELSRIGEETSEKLKIIPPKLIVVRHIRPKDACRFYQKVEAGGVAVKIAPPPMELITKSIAAPELLAYL